MNKFFNEIQAIGRKLDIRNDVLRDIKVDTSAIKGDTSSIKNDTSSLPEIKNIISSFVVEQREYNLHLEKILELLS